MSTNKDRWLEQKETTEQEGFSSESVMKKFSNRWGNLGKGVRDEKEASNLFSDVGMDLSFVDEIFLKRENVNTQLKIYKSELNNVILNTKNNNKGEIS